MKRFRVVNLLKFLFFAAPPLLAVVALHFLVVKHYYDAHIASGNMRYWTDEEGIPGSSWSIFTVLAASLLMWPAAAATVIIFSLQARVPRAWRNRKLRGPSPRSMHSTPRAVIANPSARASVDSDRARRDG